MLLIWPSITFTIMYESKERNAVVLGAREDVGYVSFGVLCALD